MEARLHLLRLLALQRHDAAPALPLAWCERPDAGLIAARQNAVGQVAQPLLDVGDADLEDQLQARETRVVAGHRPRSGLQAPRVVGEGQLLQGEREGVAGGEPAGAARSYLGDQLGSYIEKGVARAA